MSAIATEIIRWFTTKDLRGNVYLFQIILMALACIVRLFYIVVVFRDASALGAAQRGALRRLMLSSYWFSIGFQILLWLTEGRMWSASLAAQNRLAATVLFALALLSLVLAWLILCIKKQPQRAIISRNLLRTGNLTLGLTAFTFLLAWIMG